MRTSGIESFQLPSIDAPVLAEIVRRLAEAYRPERIYLFGSTARGDAGPDSDYDLMIIVPEDAPSYLRSEDLAYRALRGTGTAADVADLDPEQLRPAVAPEGFLAIDCDP